MKWMNTIIEATDPSDQMLGSSQSENDNDKDIKDRYSDKNDSIKPKQLKDNINHLEIK